MLDQHKVLIEENNVISLRTAVVIDDGNIVALRLMPDWLNSSIPREKRPSPKDFEWVSVDFAFLYRHMRSATKETELMNAFPCADQDIKPMRFENLPKFKLLWTDSGNGVALFLNGEPWAFIDERTHQGYSKGILKPKTAHLPPSGSLWDQALFDKVFRAK